MTDPGPCQYYLGIRIRRHRPTKTIYSDQQGYIDKILAMHGMTNCKGADTPMTLQKLHQPDPGWEFPKPDKHRYQSAVGSLMYLMMGTRPDISYAMSYVSRYSSNLTPEQEQAINKIFRYL